MKKILLLAVVALTATAMSAQTVAKKANSTATRHTSQSIKPSFSEQLISEPLEASSYGVVAIAQNENSEKALTQQLSLSEGETITPVITRNTSRSMIKESSLYSSYTGRGKNYSSGATTSWTMSFGTGTDSDGNTVDVITDVIPLPSSFSSLTSEISVEYTLSDGVITIEPQLVLTTTYYYVYIFSSATEDCSIVMTVDEDGAITTTDGDYYYYGAFTTEEFDSTFSNGTYAGYYEIITSPKYYYDGQPVEPTASMGPDCMYLFASFTYDGYYLGSSYNFGMIPAYAEIPFDNYSEEAISYEWSTPKLSYDSDEGAYVASSTQTGEDEDFTWETESGIYGATSLTATSVSGGLTDTYDWGQGVYVYSSATHLAYAAYAGDNFTISTGALPAISLANYDFAYSHYGYLATPDINTSDYSISDLILYQGKPSSPLYIEGISYMGYAPSFADNGIELTCIIRKATQGSNGASLSLGDTIAISDTPSYQLGTANVSLEFTDFYKYDEDGMTVGIDHLFIEDEFVVQFSGYDNGTFSFYPYGEYQGYYPSTGKCTTYFLKTDNTTSLYRFGIYVHQYVGFLGAVYGYLYTEDSKDISFGADGGTATLSINPFYRIVDDDGNYSTLLYLEDDSEIPDWLEVSYENENYSTTPWSFDLVLTAEAITDDTEERSGSFRLYQPGAFLDITVTQSASGGISSTIVDSSKPVVTVDGDNIIISEDTAAEVYSVAGMKVAQGESTIDASALSSGVYIVKLADGTAVKVIK